MSDNLDALKRGYEAFNKGDIDAVLGIFADDIRWEGPNTDGVPMSGVHEGKQAVAQALGRIGEDFESFDVSPDEFVEQDDTIVVLSHVTAKAKETGEDLKLPGAEIWRMSDGKGQRVQSLLDTAATLKALGR